MTGVIELEDMEFYAYHGCFKEEQVVGNKFKVTLSMTVDCSLAAATDNIADAANYQTAYQIVSEQMSIKSHLLENVAGRILSALGEKMKGIKSARIKISKMNPPLGGKVGASSVIVERIFN
ncbi:MAG: dihydroneopterin aldolase [Salinivirgaceae bacterium]|nr:dihydroneopterin aldolase [Salinivirgaceae bacterium]